MPNFGSLLIPITKNRHLWVTEMADLMIGHVLSSNPYMPNMGFFISHGLDEAPVGHHPGPVHHADVD